VQEECVVHTTPKVIATKTAVSEAVKSASGAAPTTTGPSMGVGAQAPVAEAPGTNAPTSEAPDAQTPGSAAPVAEAPGTTSPASEAPDAQTPGSAAPVAVAPETDSPVPEVGEPAADALPTDNAAQQTDRSVSEGGTVTQTGSAASLSGMMAGAALAVPVLAGLLM
jgi:hypothetical protein